MNGSKEVSREEAEQIWNCNCPVCGGKLLGSLDVSKTTVSVNVICEFGCKKFNVPPRPMLPQRI